MIKDYADIECIKINCKNLKKKNFTFTIKINFKQNYLVNVYLLNNNLYIIKI